MATPTPRLEKEKDDTGEMCILEDVLEDVSSANFDGLDISS